MVEINNKKCNNLVEQVVENANNIQILADASASTEFTKNAIESGDSLVITNIKDAVSSTVIFDPIPKAEAYTDAQFSIERQRAIGKEDAIESGLNTEISRAKANEDIIESGYKSFVKANETLSGSETKLSELTVGGIKYKNKVSQEGILSSTWVVPLISGGTATLGYSIDNYDLIVVVMQRNTTDSDVYISEEIWIDKNTTNKKYLCTENLDVVNSSSTADIYTRYILLQGSTLTCGACYKMQITNVPTISISEANDHLRIYSVLGIKF